MGQNSKNEKATRLHNADKGGSHSTDISQGHRAIPVSLKHRKISNFNTPFCLLSQVKTGDSGPMKGEV